MYHLTYGFSHHLLIAESSLKSCHVGKCKYRNFESITEFNEICCFSCASGRKSSVRNLCLIAISIVRLASVCNSANSSSVQTKEACYDILAVSCLCFKKLTIISDS